VENDSQLLSAVVSLARGRIGACLPRRRRDRVTLRSSEARTGKLTGEREKRGRTWRDRGKELKRTTLSNKTLGE
jgi:hypothetical protein